MLQSQKDDARSHKADSSGSSPRSDGPCFLVCALPYSNRLVCRLSSPLRIKSTQWYSALTSESRTFPRWLELGWRGPRYDWDWSRQAPTRPRPQEQGKKSGLSQAVSFSVFLTGLTVRYLMMNLRCIQEVSYLTSPQAMNPLPNRPLLNNGPLPLSLPNVPSFEHMAYNGRPRKVMPEAGKDYPLLSMSNMEMLSGPSSAPAGSNTNTLERNNPFAGSSFPQQAASSSNLGQHAPRQGPPAEREGETDGSEPQPTTAIFRADEITMERLRQAHEASEQTRLEGGLNVGANAWERRTEEEEVREEEVESDDDDTSTLLDEAEGSKVWKSKRTLRKWVLSVFYSVQ